MAFREKGFVRPRLWWFDNNFLGRRIHKGTLQWWHNERHGVYNHRRHGCSLDRLFRRRSKKTSKLRVTGLCEGNSPVPGEFPSQRSSNTENVCIWWRHHEKLSKGSFARNLKIPLLVINTNWNPAWISDYMHYNVWAEITYPFPIFNAAAIVKIWELIGYFISHFTVHEITYPRWD